MESRCLRHTELPQTTNLFSDFLYHFARVAPFYSLAPLDSSSYQAAAAALRYPAERRAALVAALREQNGDSPALEQLARPETLVVATGQQVGLCSGPAYTAYKALTAIKLARRLTADGIPAIPVFWMATEDHDLAEVDHCWVFDPAGRPARVEAAPSAPANTPAGLVAVPCTVASQLEAWLNGFPYGAEILQLVAESYVPGRTFGEAFAQLLRALFGNRGLLLLDPLHPGLRALAAPLLREAVHHADHLAELLAERNRALEAAGYHVQVRVEPDTSLVFLLDHGRRHPLRRRAGRYVHPGGDSTSAQELAGHAERLSPNALLRPVVQDYILPTVACVAGPAELAYLAQSQVLYEQLLGRTPVFVHRASFTLLDARADKLMTRYGLDLKDLFASEAALRDRIARRLTPTDLVERLAAARTRVTQQVEQLRAELRRFDPTLDEAMERSGRKILYQLAKIERKAAREALRRDARAAQDAEYLHNRVYPHKRLQERFYSILPFLAQSGLDALEQIYDSVRLDCPDHQVLVL
ncbi:MAG: bacillithiol biosynthesis cysteine-adding enzyme BshC [Bryobacterales bacterium]|nr:bacillithiol biosynthesis cysteine-adding enzyme BshC [Bryobacteraceae bacterium]MDW8354145.1 bacillithiol biosynthesis cysteine-adding enzyme BshC [Bryobacterales bacterium]